MPPVICFGQQPCGFFPRRFLYAKIVTARRLQAELGGEIVFFCHDSDHDPRETRTLLRDRRTGREAALNFTFTNSLEKDFAPLAVKRIAPGWQDKTARQLPCFAGAAEVAAFRGVQAETAADFCLSMYRAMGLLDGIRVVRSSDPEVRRAALEVDDFFVDVLHEGTTVRARWQDGALRLHKGGGSFIELPGTTFDRAQISPTRDTRLRWMQSVLHCTHYVTGAGEMQYLHPEETPEITFVTRDAITESDRAYVPE